jgi:Flp pilus assembly protein TadG
MRSITSRVRHTLRRARERGQAMVEFALALPVIMLLFVGLIEASDALYTYSAVVAATRDGARLGVRTSSTSQIRSLVLVNLAQLRDPTSPSDVNVTGVTVAGKASVRVQACHKHKLLVDYPLLPLPNPINICATTTMRTFST